VTSVADSATIVTEIGLIGRGHGGAVGAMTTTPVPVTRGRTGPITVIGNVLWFVLAGVWMAIGYLVAGPLPCITIIGIPFGIASFKLAGLALVPFGKVVVRAGAPLPPEARVWMSM
jgi:uncharacterized membrane protein YccF (DUF307 family)